MDPSHPDRLPPLRPLLLAWGLFWLLMAALAAQEHLRRGQVDLWKPLLWEGSSALVATALLLPAWRHLPRLDDRLATPAHWLRLPLALLLPAALVFVGAVQGLRIAVHAAVGDPYRHPPWPELLALEGLKFALFYGLFVAALFGLRSHAALQAQRLRAQQQATQAREAQMRQLAQQIEPHFLFNALNTIAGTVHESPDQADRLITRLAALLRASIDASRQPLVPLADELELARAYAELMQGRFGARVRVDFDVDPGALACTVPVLLLQPLLENAFRHGVERQPGPVHVAVAARLHDSRLRLTVQDDAGTLGASDPRPSAESGVGLANLRQRLALAHGDAASLHLQPLSPRGVRACVELPCAC